MGTTVSQALLPEFDHEADSTRRTLERVPLERFDWRPHPRSYPLGHLASHLANLLTWTGYILDQESLDLAPGGVPAPRGPELRTREELLGAFDRNREAARAALLRTDDARFAQPWTLLRNGQQVLKLPRAAVLRSFVMNHSIHHRAQLGVYLRLNDVPVPATYGASADEAT